MAKKVTIDKDKTTLVDIVPCMWSCWVGGRSRQCAEECRPCRISHD